MSDLLMAMNCPGCGGLLRKFDMRLFQCAYCGIKYILLGDEYPIPGLTQVIDERETEDVRGMYLWSPTHVCWDSPPEVKEEARLLGIRARRHRVRYPGVRLRDWFKHYGIRVWLESSQE